MVTTVASSNTAMWCGAVFVGKGTSVCSKTSHQVMLFINGLRNLHKDIWNWKMTDQAA